MADPLDNMTSSEQLRRLLLREEQERIDRLEARVGDGDRLKGSIVPIIADALREAGVKDHHRLAGAIAPIVVQSIKTEIHNSRDMMVDALYPITGRLVAAAVRNAFKDLVEQLNSRLDSSLSVDRWRTKVKAKLTGRSEAEILLSEGAAFEIIELLLINRQSGLLIARAGAESEEAGIEGHLLSSILTAIMAFVRDAMRDSSEQDLRTLHVADMRLHLQVSPAAILAIKTKGPPPAGFETALSETFYDFLTRWGDELSDPDQSELENQAAFTEDLEGRFTSLLEARQTNFEAPSRKGLYLLSALGLIFVGWLGWSLFAGWQEDRIESKARSLIANKSELAGYPIDVSYDRSQSTLTLSGLVPLQATLDVLEDELEETFPTIDLVKDVSVLPIADVDVSDVRTLRASDEEQVEVLRALEQRLLGRLTALSGDIEKIERRLPDTMEQDEAAFRQWLDHQSIEFADSSVMDDVTRAEATLREMADRVTNLPEHVGLRVIGYDDALGEALAKIRISRQHANAVADRLMALGVAADRLQIVGRGDEKRIGDTQISGSANRRVEFELTLQANKSSIANTNGGDRNDNAR